MRTIAKVDANQKQIVAAFREMGFSVLHLHQVGGGCPDILIGKRKRNYLVEIKSDEQPRSRRKLTPDEEKFHAGWGGMIFIVENIDQAFKLGNMLDDDF